MNTSLKHLSFFNRRKLELACKIINQAIQPEMILLFGVFSDPEESALYSERLPLPLITYDLLVVSREGDSRSDYELQDIVENRCRDHVPVTVLVHDIGYVNRKIREGHYFFNQVCLEGICIYSSMLRNLRKPVSPDWARVRELAELDYGRWAKQARAFYNCALFNQEREEWNLAVFMLHQTTEHIYQAILLVFMGYKPTTHNLDKLRRYTNRFSLELVLLFTRHGKEEDHLFRLLIDGYVDARYKETFLITREEVSTLRGRVEQLLAIAEKICRNRFLMLERKASQ